MSRFCLQKSRISAIEDQCFEVSISWDAPKGLPKIRLSSVLSRYASLHWTADCTNVVYDRNQKIWKFGRISDSGTRFVAISGCLSSEVTPVEVINTICHSHRTIVHIQHLHIATLVIRDALLTLRVPKM